MEFPKGSSPQVFRTSKKKLSKKWTKEEIILKVGEWYTSKVITTTGFEEHCEFRKRVFG